MSLWLYATLDGVGSARELDRLCDTDDAYRWLCGGVGVNHHTLGDFRVAHAQWLDDQLTRNVAALLSQGLVSMNRVAHDGMRVRAHAGAASFRRRETLEQLMQDAQAQVQALKLEVGDDPGAGTRRVRAARQRAATERQQRIERALQAMDEIGKNLADKSKKRQADKTQDEPARTEAAPDSQPVVGEPNAEEQPKDAKKSKKPKEPRVSTTDHEARVMKMADGGFRPAFNAQLAVDTETLIITGVDLINSGSDMNQMLPTHEQHQDRYARVPEQWLTDGGFAKHDQIEQLDARATQVFAPVVAPRDKQRDPHQPLPTDSKALGQWRERMGTDEAKQIYKERAASIECTNAHLRNRGLQRFNVRGLIKARAVLLWHALAHNLKRMMAMNIASQPETLKTGRSGLPLRPNRSFINATSPHKTNFRPNRLVALLRRAWRPRCVGFMVEIEKFTGSQTASWPRCHALIADHYSARGASGENAMPTPIRPAAPYLDDLLRHLFPG